MSELLFSQRVKLAQRTKVNVNDITALHSLGLINVQAAKELIKEEMPEPVIIADDPATRDSEPADEALITQDIEQLKASDAK